MTIYKKGSICSFAPATLCGASPGSLLESSRWVCPLHLFTCFLFTWNMSWATGRRSPTWWADRELYFSKHCTQEGNKFKWEWTAIFEGLRYRDREVGKARNCRLSMQGAQIWMRTKWYPDLQRNLLGAGQCWRGVGTETTQMLKTNGQMEVSSCANWHPVFINLQFYLNKMSWMWEVVRPDSRLQILNLF